MFVTVYGTPTCSYCKKATKLLDNREIEYDYVDVSDSEEKANMNLRLGFTARSVPQIFVDDTYLKDGFNQLLKVLTEYDELAKYDND